MMKSILVGLDGSPHSRVAVDLAIQWAKKLDAFVVGIGVIDEPAIRQPQPVPLGGLPGPEVAEEKVMADARRKVEHFLEQLALRCAEEKVACKLLEDVGVPWKQIVTEAQRYDAVMLGRRTYFHFETQEGPDDTLVQVLKHCPRPVITVPDSLREGRQIMVAYDGSLQAARAVQALEFLGLANGREIIVVSIGESHVEAARHADRAAEFLRLHDLKAISHAVASTDPPGEVLIEELRKIDPHLLVMGAYGKPTWREFIFGSVTRAVLKMTPVPLLLAH